MKTIRQRPVSDFYLVFLYAFFLLIIQVIIKIISWKKAVQGLYFLKKATDKTPIIINWSKLATSVFCYLDSQYSDEICTWVLDILDELDYYDFVPILLNCEWLGRKDCAHIDLFVSFRCSVCDRLSPLKMWETLPASWPSQKKGCSSFIFTWALLYICKWPHWKLNLI